MQTKSFSERCYDLLKQVPEGSVTTYAELARALDTRAYRAVGQAMNKNPNAPNVPCHRVICSDGKIGGYAFGVARKRDLLLSEGIRISQGVVQNLETVLYSFSRR